MKLQIKQIVQLLLSIMLLFAFAFAACAVEEGEGEYVDEHDGIKMIIKGRVNEVFQIITSDGVYEIDFEGKGAELIENVGKTVEVTGYVTEDDDIENEEDLDNEDKDDLGDDGQKTITVTSFKFIEIY